MRSNLFTKTRTLLRWLFTRPEWKRFPAASPGAKKKIAYIKRAVFSYSNVRFREQLEKNFPEFELVVIDLVEDVLKGNKRIALVNFLIMLRLYGRDILAGRREMRDCFLRTPWLFHKMRELLRDYMAPAMDDFAFTIQTQSIFDASLPPLPHFVYTDHAHLTNLAYPHFDRRLLFPEDWIALERTIYSHAVKTFTMSQHVRRSLIEQYALPPERVACVYAGSNIDPDPLPLRNAGYTNRTLVFVGIDWERKGGPELIEAFRLALDRIPDARLIIVGSSPAVSDPRIDVRGRVPRAEVKNILVQASAVSLPSKVEPFGILPIEAHLQKLPVIASNIGALPDIVLDGKTGRLIDPANRAEFAAAIVELLSDPEKCRAFGEAGFHHVEKLFTWDAVGRKVREEIAASLPLLFPPGAVSAQPQTRS